VYIISWPDTRCLLEVGENTGSCNTGEAGCVPENTREDTERRMVR